ncbi:MAG TPA: hypothetical protein VN515_08410, partial [Terriglobales bacterium]|nr:hypothetical protein [Terriglobales bacterium]
SQAMLTLPNIGRDSSSLMVYQPATAPGGQVAGGLMDQNTFMLDGGNNTDDLDGTNTAYSEPFAHSGAGVMPTPVESLQEMKVATSNQTADYGASSGGEIMMVTKRGTTQWHGSAYDFFQGNWLNANTWSNNRFNTPQIKTHQNRFGGSIGGPVSPLGNFLGGKTFFYLNFEGNRYPQSGTEEETVPSATLRQGILTFNNAAGTPIQYNLATAQDCGPSGNSACDPRGLGISPLIAKDWSTYTPVGNDPSAGDTLNTVGYRGQLSIPVKDDFVVGRFDHDFGKNWRAMVSYRWFDEVAESTADLDFGGVVPGDKLGQYTAVANRPIQPDYWVASLTGQITSNLTNDFHFNYLRNWWQWQTAGVPFQLAAEGVNAGVTVDPSGAGSGIGLDGMDIGWGDARQRVWNGHDYNYRDDVSWLHGNHFIQFGTTLTHDWLHHARDDDGNSALESLRYIIGTAGNGSGVSVSANYRPPTCTAASTASSACLPASQNTSWDNLYYSVLGVVGQANQVVTRVGNNLTANPLGTPAFDYVNVNNDEFYFTDSWHVKPSLTLTFGLNYSYATPPTEVDGKQTLLVDQNGVPVDAASYFATKERFALEGQNYNPTLGFAPVGSVGNGTQQMFNPWYGGFAPRIAVAWNPSVGGNGVLAKLLGNNSSVLRGGWSRLIDRTNNVGNAITALLGVGFIQSVACNGASSPNTTPGASCLGAGGTVNAMTAFRLGPDGTTAPLPSVAPNLPVPVYPGVNAAANGTADITDPNWHPGISDEFTLSLQRQLPGKIIVELGYVGRHGYDDFQGQNFNTVPYMMTVGGQSFESAYASMANEILKGLPVTTQPFFEAALKGSAYCNTFSTCTAAVASKESSQFQNQTVVKLWSDLDKSWVFGPTLPQTTGLAGVIDSTAFARDNYNAGTISVNKRSDNGLTINSNFTWASSLDDGQTTQTLGNNSSTANPFDENYSYGPSGFGSKFAFNLTGVYALPFRASQKGLLGRVIGGWSFAPIFTWNSGSFLAVSDSSSAFGQQGNTADAIFTGSSSLLDSMGPQHVVATTSVGKNGNSGVQENFFSNPQAVFSAFRAPILGQDSRAITSFGYAPSTWNFNATAAKDIQISEQFGASFTAEMLNVFNHPFWNNPSLSLTNPTNFGVISGKNGNRTIELGLRLHF